MATPKQYDIFISYRREGGKNYARILKPELEKRGFNNRVFLDFDELKDGKFDKRIIDAIDSAPIFIIILTDGCLDRCVNEDDWVRLEIAHALETNKHIIPVVCDKSFNDFPVNIPEFIRKGLGQHQFSQIDTDALLRASVNELVEFRITPIINKFAKEDDKINKVGAEVHVITDSDCNVLRFCKHIGIAKVGDDNIIRLIKGEHLLDFVSVEYGDIKCSRRFNVEDCDSSYIIEVRLQEQVKERKKKELINVSLLPHKDESGKWGFKNLSDNIVISCRWADVKHFEEELAAVQDETGKWGFIDKLGELVIPCKWEYAFGFSEGLALVSDDNFRCGYVDRCGKLLIPCKWEDANDFSEGLALVENDKGKKGYIDKTGNVMIPCKWEDASDFSEGLALVENDKGKKGYIDKTGNIVIPCKWEDASDFREGLSMVQDENYKYGFIDKTGAIIIPCKWNSVGFFIDGLANVRDETWMCGFIDRSGTLVIPCVWDSVGVFKDGLAYVRDGSGKYGFIDRVGNLVIPCIWEKVGSFTSGVAPVYDDRGDCWIMDKTGQVLGRW